MKIGFIGLGKMGSQMVIRLLKGGHEVVVFDLDTAAVDRMQQAGAKAVPDREALVAAVDPAVIWLMIPSQYVDREITKLLEIVPAGTILIDGGNSDFRLTRKRAGQCLAKGVSLVDVGTSGGVLGLEKGFSLMVGGSAEAINIIRPVLETLAQEDGWHHFGDCGAGHYTKMVHNAIEYGLMQSYAEGYRMLREGPYASMDLAAAGEVWKHGSIISSLLNDLTVDAIRENPSLDGIEGYVAESGETRWTLESARDLGISLPSIEAAFQVRLDSQKGQTNFATKLLAAMRNKFGGHAINRGQ